MNNESIVSLEPTKNDANGPREGEVSRKPPPPPYFDTYFSAAGAVKEEEEPVVKIQMIRTVSDEQEAKTKKTKVEKLQNHLKRCYDLYVGGGKSCPLTCGIIPARAAAWVLSLVYIVLHLALIVKLREPHFSPIVRGVISSIAGFHLLFMTLAFVGLCRKRSRLFAPFIVVQSIETAILSAAIAISICVPVLYIFWTLVSGDGKPFDMFNEEGFYTFSAWTLITAGFHLFLALFIRAAMVSRREH